MTPPPEDSKPGDTGREGVYYPPPPGKPKGGNGGCLKAAGLTCGVLFLLAAIGVVWFGVVLRNAVHHPGQGGFLGTITGTIQAVQEGQQIQKAVIAYHQKNNAYPRSLTDLVVDGETDGRAFHSVLDPDPSPAHISWRYDKPAENAPGKTPLLLLRGQISAGNGPPHEADIVITLDGSTPPAGSAPFPPNAPASPPPLDGG